MPGIPFGFILGVAVVDAPIDNLIGWMGSWIILGGAAQLTMTSLLTDGASAIAAVAAALFVNARHVMYSIAMATPFRGQPRWFRLLGPYLLLDQVFAASDLQRDRRPDEFRQYYLGAGVTMIGPWVIWVALGVVVGAQVPPEWNLGFAVPVLFAGLMILGVRNVAGATAAVIGFTLTVALSSLPNRSGMLIGAAVAVIVSAFVPVKEAPR